jgi:hypothetical protein
MALLGYRNSLGEVRKKNFDFLKMKAEFKISMF